MLNQLTISFARVLATFAILASGPLLAQDRAGLDEVREDTQRTVEQTVRQYWDPKRGDWFSSRWVARYYENDARWHEKELEGEYRSIAGDIVEAINMPSNFVDLQVTSCLGARSWAWNDYGGTITVCAPIALELKTRDQAAFLIAHEIAHIVFNDIGEKSLLTDPSRRYRRYNIDQNQGALSQDHTASNAWNIDPLVSERDQAKPDYSETELRADRFAVDLMVSAGFSIQGALSLIERMPHNPNGHYASPDDRAAAVLVYAEEKYLTYLDSIRQTPWNGSMARALGRTDAYLQRVKDVTRVFVSGFVYSEAFPFRIRRQLPKDRTREQVQAQACYDTADEITLLQNDYPHAEQNIHLMIATMPYCFYYGDGRNNGLESAYGTVVSNFISQHADLPSYRVPTLGAIAVIGSLSSGGLLDRVYKEFIRRMPTELEVSVSTDLNEQSPEAIQRLRSNFNRGLSLGNHVCELEGVLLSNGVQPSYDRVINYYTQDVWVPFVQAIRDGSKRLPRSTSRADRAKAARDSEILIKRITDECTNISNKRLLRRLEHQERLREIRLRGRSARPPRHILDEAFNYALFSSQFDSLQRYIADTRVYTLMRRSGVTEEIELAPEEN